MKTHVVAAEEAAAADDEAAPEVDAAGATDAEPERQEVEVPCVTVRGDEY
jgi:hypothetical protein